MKRWLEIANLVGVVLIAGLCVAQWGVNRALHLRGIENERVGAEQEAKIAELDKTITGYTADLDDFRKQIAVEADGRERAEEKLTKTEAARAKVAADRDQVQAAYDNVTATVKKWEAAVAARDQTIRQANELAQKLAADRNTAVTKYNDLVAKYNAAGEEIRKAGEVIKQVAAERDEAIAKFNALAVKYNALAGGGEKGGAATRP